MRRRLCSFRATTIGAIPCTYSAAIYIELYCKMAISLYIGLPTFLLTNVVFYMSVTLFVKLKTMFSSMEFAYRIARIATAWLTCQSVQKWLPGGICACLSVDATCFRALSYARRVNDVMLVDAGDTGQRYSVRLETRQNTNQLWRFTRQIELKINHTCTPGA